MGGRPRVLVVGAGFGGLAAAQGLAGAPVDVTVLDARNHHTFQALLYQVATAGLDPGDIAFSIRGAFHGQANVDVHLGRANSVDFEGRRLVLDGGHVLAYDFLVLAAGSSTSYLGVVGAGEHAFPVKSLAEAVRLRSHVLAQFEGAAGDPTLVGEGILTFVVVGGGPTGVELAGAITELFGVMARDFPRVAVERARVVLLEAEDHLLADFHPDSQRRALVSLRARGVDVRLGAKVHEVTAAAVRLEDGAVVPSRTVAWAAGVRVNLLADALGLEQGPGGRVVVDADLSVPGHPEVFVIGDMAAATRPEGGLHPQMAPEAIQGGRHVAEQVRRQLRGEPRAAFLTRSETLAVTIGRNDAVAELASGLRFQGRIAWLLWLRLHLMRIVAFRNRLQVLLEWCWSYFTYDRGARLINEPGEEWC
ncbi:MAG: NAD(P)/FAD-dependent oxidoreductase [Actinomycetota bacterium]|nr:NAD(P)/FAD-dependent oxidoreductase [Actinomycetota bacterium]